ncbi:hypothetical protein OCU04_007835 [Sclerotinia nivalis]|uniref:Nephrocystin 3-like N-terminal domain-containing protein n=1 Tax=Sclerotinia nivalis TaxID=352851 RepID=A0A9X0DIU1_9HELO|nr:hypothetical protein OCU04_007835 [Sclerotinia nivalis]
MDPVTALGVAAAGGEIYKSGELGNNVELREATNRLQNLVEPLRSSVHPGNKGQPPSSPTNADRAIEDICSNCINLSEEPRNLLDSLKLDPNARNPKLASFRRAVKIVWSEEKIKGLKGQLDDLRSNLETHVLVDLRYRMIQIELEQDKHFIKVDQSLQAMMKDLLDKHENTSARVERGLNNLILTQEKEHSNTRTIIFDQQVSRQKRQAELSILETLKFSSMNLRYETIAEAHQQTFEWIFCDPEVERKSWSHFNEWLRCENGIYWIHGKPGSGKSTLMRFIVQDPRSHEYAKTWAQKVALETPSFFFWNSGDVAQRSQSGLLRSLLYEILEKHCDLIPVVFPREWKTVLENTRHGIPTKATDWSLRVLKESFRTLINETSGKLSFCFFIDGLDEYEGDYWGVAEYFCELSKSKHAKFCLSSRPEIEFLDTFGRMPQLRLQDLTASDIAIYVRDKLESNPKMQSLMETSPRESSTLIKEVVNAGDGVVVQFPRYEGHS